MSRLPIVVSADRWRQDREIDPLVIIVSPGIAASTTIVIVAGTAIGAVTARLSPLAVAPIIRGPIAARLSAVVGRTCAARLRLLVGIALKILVAIIVAVGIHPVVAVFVLPVVVASSLLFVEPRAGIAKHAEIMIGELQIIFGLDAVAGELGVARHALVFLKQLGGVAALAIILAIAAIIAGHAPGLLTTAAATAAALTIIDQTKFPYRTGALRRKTSHSKVRPFTPQQSGAPDAPGPLSSRVRKFAA